MAAGPSGRRQAPVGDQDGAAVVSAARLRRHIEVLAGLGARPDGTSTNVAAAEYVAAELGALGLNVERQALPVPVLEDVRARLRVLSPYPFDVACSIHLRSGLTGVGGIRAPLRVAGKLLPRDVEQVDLRGAVALAFEDMPFEGEARHGIRYFGERVRLAHERGAVGVVFAEYRTDALITTWGIDRGLAPLPCLAVSYPDLDRLRHLAVVEDVDVEMEVIAEVREGSSDNLSAWWPGRDGAARRAGVAIIGTHTDSVPTCTGANDNGSGLALLLEIARVLIRRHPDTAALYVVTAIEEAGSIGAAEYGKRNASRLHEQIRAAIAFDQVGGTEAFLSAHGDSALNARLTAVASELGYLLRRDDEPRPALRTGLADVQPFADLGIPSAYIGGWTQDPVYHTAADTLRHVSPNALKALGDTIIRAAVELSREAGPAGAT
jgi:aminopeptidase YwaD